MQVKTHSFWKFKNHLYATFWSYGHEMCPTTSNQPTNHICIGRMSIKSLATMIIPLCIIQPKVIHNEFHTQSQPQRDIIIARTNVLSFSMNPLLEL